MPERSGDKWHGRPVPADIVTIVSIEMIVITLRGLVGGVGVGDVPQEEGVARH